MEGRRRSEPSREIPAETLDSRVAVGHQIEVEIELAAQQVADPAADPVELRPELKGHVAGRAEDVEPMGWDRGEEWSGTQVGTAGAPAHAPDCTAGSGIEPTHPTRTDDRLDLADERRRELDLEALLRGHPHRRLVEPDLELDRGVSRVLGEEIAQAQHF